MTTPSHLDVTSSIPEKWPRFDMRFSRAAPSPFELDQQRKQHNDRVESASPTTQTSTRVATPTINDRSFELPDKVQFPTTVLDSDRCRESSLTDRLYLVLEVVLGGMVKERGDDDRLDFEPCFPWDHTPASPPRSDGSDETKVATPGYKVLLSDLPAEGRAGDALDRSEWLDLYGAQFAAKLKERSKAATKQQGVIEVEAGVHYPKDSEDHAVIGAVEDSVATQISDAALDAEALAAFHLRPDDSTETDDEAEPEAGVPVFNGRRWIESPLEAWARRMEELEKQNEAWTKEDAARMEMA